jgi:rhodanese-related sulfurtransferase
VFEFVLKSVGDVELEFRGKVEEISTEFDVPEIEASRAVELVQSGAPVVVLDVRSRAEYLVSKIPGAIHVGKGGERTLSEVIDEQLGKGDDTTWMMYCAAGYNSARSISGLPRKLKERMFNILGGAIGYANAGGSLVVPSGEESTNRIHGYDAYWARFVRPPFKPVVPD